MKTIKYNILLLLAIVTLFTACEFDNYDAPTITFSGRLMDGDEPLNTKRGIVFKLYQYREDGYISAGASSLDVHMDQEGNFSSLLFAGRYKMVLNINDGDVEDPDIYTAHTWKGDYSPVNQEGVLDTIYFTLDKNKKMDFQVTPYYKFENINAFYEDEQIVVRFKVRKLTDSQETTDGLRKINLFMSPTMHINRDTPVFFTYSSRETAVDTDLEFRCNLANYYSDDNYVNNYRDYVYVRLGAAKQNAVNVYNYSPVIKVTGIPQETITKHKK